MVSLCHLRREQHIVAGLYRIAVTVFQEMSRKFGILSKIYDTFRIV